MTIYRKGLYVGSPAWWDASPMLEVLLLDAAGSYAFDVEDLFVADLTPGSNELATTNYARQSVTVNPATWNATLDRWELPAATITFANLGPAVGPPTVGGVVVYQKVTNDADSPVLIHQAASKVLDSTDLTITVAGTGMIQVVGA